MSFRKYQKDDAEEIIKWIETERELRLWSADRYQDFPITSDDINNNYALCMKDNNFFPMTLVDNDKIIGHLILRYPENNQSIVRLGFIIVDKNIRKKGYGKKIILEAIKYAREYLHASIINLGVFTCNENALKCYLSVGFEIVDTIKNAYNFYDESWDLSELVLKKER